MPQLKSNKLPMPHLGLAVVLSLLIAGFDWLGLFDLPKGGIETGVVVMQRLQQPILDQVLLPWQALAQFQTYKNRVVELEEELAEGLSQQHLLTELENENQAMRELLESPLPPDWTYVVAPVYGVQADALKIGVGEKQKVQVGQTVVWQDVYIGQVDQVSLNSARVRLAQAVNNKITAKIADSSIDGLVIGQGPYMELVQVLQGEEVESGAVVVTSGLDQAAPDLIIGTLDTITADEQGVFQRGRLKSPISPELLETVFVVTGVR